MSFRDWLQVVVFSGKWFGRAALWDVGWCLGLVMPFADGFRYDRSCLSQAFEAFVRFHAKFFGISWREVDGGGWHGVKLIRDFLRETREAKKKVEEIRHAVNKKFGLNLKSAEAVNQFLAFVNEELNAEKSEVCNVNNGK